MMMKLRKIGSVLLVAIAAGLWACQAAADEVQLFSRLPDADFARISPDGQLIASIVRVGDSANRVSRVEVLNISSGERKHYFEVDNEAVYLGGLDWLNDEMVVLYTEVVQDAEEFDYWTRMVLLNVKTGDLGHLFNDEYVRQRRYIGVMVDTLPDDKDHVLVHSDSKIYKLNIYTKKRERFEFRIPYTGKSSGRLSEEFLTDNHSRPRALVRRVEHRTHVGYTDSKDNKFTFRWQFDHDSNEYVDPLGFSSEGDFYIVRYHEDRLAVHSVDTDSEDAGEQIVFADPEYDVSPISIRFARNVVVGVRHPARQKDHYFDPPLQSLQQKLDGLIPNAYNRLIDMNADGNRYVLYSVSDVDPGTYYIGDLQANTLTPFAQTRRGIDRNKMGRAKRIQFSARDGTKIEGLVTLPAGGEPPFPIVVRADLGSLSTPQFDTINQMFVASGIGVLEVDTRGTNGYGFEFKAASQKRWGLEPQDDLADGVDYVVQDGIADPERLCIMGEIYGGYAAMMAIVKEPSRYRCAVSINGISDLDKHVDSIPNSIRQPLLKHEIGTYGRDLWDRSPLKYAENIQTPLLLIHEEDWYGVDKYQSQKMESALRKDDKSVRYENLPVVSGARNEKQREVLYSAINQFVIERIGVD
ncbi:MAG: prolyl oligopeptidase family serine peptidase [Cellvibrionaceae bacterium]